MFDTAHYLHYVLDAGGDPHFTEDLLRLSPQAYLWHRLKKIQLFHNVVFVTMGVEGPELEVYDSQSEQLLRPVKKGWFSSAKREEIPQRIGLRRFSPGQFKQQNETLLQWLLERQKSEKTERTALVLTPEALRLLYEAADKKGRELLHKNIKNSPREGVLILRVDKDPVSLRSTFLEGRRWLSALDPMVAAALRGNARPLMTALSEQLREQLVDLSGYERELLPMLMLEALEESLGEDDPAQLEQQAEYLRLCCRSGQGVMQDHDPAKPLRREEIYDRLLRPDFRSALRRQTHQLWDRDPGGEPETVFVRRYGKLLPEQWAPVCDDELARTVTALTLPQAYLEKNRGQLHTLQSLKKALQTLWNRDRNPAVCGMLRTACDAVRRASELEDWDTVTDGMTLLRLCAGQICADPALGENLSGIFEMGEELLKASAAYFAQKDTLDRNSEDEMELYRVSKHKLTVQLSNQAILESRQRYLEALRSSLNQAILYFDESPGSRHVEELINRSMEQLKQRLDRVAEEPQYTIPEPEDSLYDL